MRSKQLPGLPVLCLESGNRAGRIKQVVVDPKRKKVVALLVHRAPARKPLLPIESVHALGTHAVTIQSEDDLRAMDEMEEVAALVREGPPRVAGTPIVTVKGELVGSVHDFDLDDSGDIVEIYVSRGVWKAISGREPTIPGRMLLALGRDALIVANEALERVRPSPPRKAEASSP